MALGAIGVVLPVLPTTPFLLLASACFMRGSSRFRAWFQTTRLYQRHIKSFAENRAMTIKAKLRILIPVTAILSIAFLCVDSMAGRVIIVAAALLKWGYFLFGIKTINPGVNPTARPSPE